MATNCANCSGVSMFSSRWALTTKYSCGLQAKARQHVAGLDLGQVVVEHLVHRAAGLDDPVGRQPLAQQVLAGDRRIGQVDVADVVDDLAVDLLGHALVEAAVARLHVEDRDLLPLGGDGGQAAVGVAQNQHGIGLHLAQDGVGPADDLADRLGGGRAGGVQKEVGLAELQVLEEDLVQFVVVVLAGVDEDVVERPVQERPSRGRAG